MSWLTAEDLVDLRRWAICGAVVLLAHGAIAAASPKAVASSASAMPGATTAKLVVCDFEMPMKLFMMPHTVPNRPTNGAVAPMVASTPVPRRMRRP